ncbi:MAG TPA: AIR carboxylase family protein, partial [Woeseiaceae bacterium]|nr:AIR carboxylase family protein [Woeseiaceae bacterium]
MKKAKISIIMGSKSDWPTMKHSSEMLKKLNIEHEVKIVSAHRTPDLLFSFAETAKNDGV